MRANATVILTLLVVLLTAGTAASDGCFMWRNGADLREPEQLAVLHHDGEKETLIVRAKYEGEAYDFAWVIPVPAVPELEAVEAREPTPGRPISLFTELSMYTRERERSKAAPRVQTGMSATPHTEASADVEVIDRKRVGIFDITVLRADDAAALVRWLELRRFKLPEDREGVFDHYVRKGWYFVACRIGRYELTDKVEKDMRKGTLQPIRLSFACETPVYPLRMSALNSGETDVLLYVMSEKPMVPAAGPHVDDFPLEHSVCGFRQLGTGLVDPEYGTYARVDSSDIPTTWEALRPEEDSTYLCKYRATLESSEMADDITFEEFEPTGYWAGVQDTASTSDTRAIAAWVLAWHDPGNLMELVGSADPALRSAAAVSEKASVGVLKCLVSDPDRNVRLMVASNTETPEMLLRTLAEDEAYRVREAVAGNASATEDVLLVLAADSQRMVRERVSEHPLAGERVWSVWTGSENRTVRIAAASFEDAPPSVIEILAADEDVEVRKRIARRRDVPTELRMQLAKDPSPLVREALVRSCTEEEGHILTLLAGDSDQSVREAVAWYWRTPLETLTMLADDPSPEVRAKVAMNRVTPKADIVRLATDPEESVRLKVWHGLRVRGFTPQEAEEMTGITHMDRVRATYEANGGTWGEHPSHNVDDKGDEAGDGSGDTASDESSDTAGDGSGDASGNGTSEATSE
jgi:hypothetical protein